MVWLLEVGCACVCVVACACVLVVTCTICICVLLHAPLVSSHHHASTPTNPTARPLQPTHVTHMGVQHLSSCPAPHGGQLPPPSTGPQVSLVVVCQDDAELAARLLIEVCCVVGVGWGVGGVGCWWVSECVGGWVSGCMVMEMLVSRLPSVCIALYVYFLVCVCAFHTSTHPPP